MHWKRVAAELRHTPQGAASAFALFVLRFCWIVPAIASDAPPPEFGMCHRIEFEDARGRTFWLDGRPVPYSFTLSTSATLRAPILDAPSAIDFVLILPAEVDVGDGIVLRVTRPFYMATTVLNQQQAANLKFGRWGTEEAATELYVETMAQSMLDEEVPERTLDAVSQYLSDPQVPALVDRPSRAMDYARELAWRSTLNVRLPRLAEWYHAMRGGSDAKWWWGNDWNPDLVSPGVGPVDRADIALWLKAVEPVASRDPNQYGLYHMIGNVAQLAYPSDEERMQLRTYFGPWAAQPVGNQPRGTRSSYQIHEHSSLEVGGSVAVHPERLANWSVDLPWIVGRLQSGHRQRVDEFGAGFFAMVGVRLVIDMPEGEFTIRH